MSRFFYFPYLFALLACSKSSNSSGNNSGPVPVVKVSDVSQGRQLKASPYRFYVDLSAAYSQSVSVSYATADGTAKGNTDYTPASGTLTFPAGTTELYVDVPVTGDSLRKTDQQFYMQLSNPVNCTLGVAKATGTIINSDGTYLPTDTTGYTTPATYAGYTLAWSDEFNGNALNTQNWNYETGGSGWGNQELENYTARPQNVFVSAGNLIIEARQESYGGNNYTSGRLNTIGKQQFTYGRIDIRAKLPVSKGMWPALWMLGSNISTVPWPGCGETDIMELIGTNPRQIVGSLHWKQQDGSEGTYNNTYTLPGQDFSQQFHVFSLIWAKDQAQFLVDDQVYVSGGLQNVTSGVYPFNSPFFFIFNVAVGGNWPGSPDNSTLFPQRMFVDYVRVFQP
ncbi:MAG TPA: family 16 glycosylhydrolase [Puia sp.]|nr:family 16 glycosylhydrolase [Puia sp.]